MTTKEIINSVLEHEDISASSFAKKIRIHPTQIYDLQSGKTKKISASIGNKIVSVYPYYSLSWLLTGEGNMLKPNPRNEVEELTANERAELERAMAEGRVTYIPLIHIDSVGGIHSPNSLTNSEQYMERMIPFPDARPDDVAILQSGDSMSPTIPPGAILQIRRVVDWQEYFGYGNVFVLWLNDDRRITKQVLKYVPDPKTYVTCHSYNPDAADEELPKSMIKQVWKVVNVLINKGW